MANRVPSSIPSTPYNLLAKSRHSDCILMEDFQRDDSTSTNPVAGKIHPFMQEMEDALGVYIHGSEITWEGVTKKQRINADTGALQMQQASLELLSSYWNIQNKSKGEIPLGKASSQTEAAEAELVRERRRLSTEEIMKVAGARFVQFQDQRDSYFSMLTYPFGSSFSELSEEDMKEVELSQLLLAAAEKVGEQNFDRASRLLSYCELLASKRSTPAQRIVLCFAEALHERIETAQGRKAPPITDSCLKTGLLSLTCHRQLPFTQITQFTAVQALVEHTATATRIHVVDLALRSGIQMIVLMQALLERKGKPVELLKVTAIAITEREKVEESGKRLISTAKTMGLNFSFRMIVVKDMKDIQEDMVDIDDGEAVAVYASIVLRTLISRQDCLERLTKVIRQLNPSVMVITEVQANHNSPSFVARFIEALFFYSTYFDCLDMCMAEDTESRTVLEHHFCLGINNILSAEGNDRTTRNVKIDVWRAFFRRYRMVEMGLSDSSLYQARLVAQQFPFASFCTLHYDGKCLLVGWRGTPVLSVSVWKFR
ncbi:hypothetical protein MLD38_035723 [Melastoma candidum]|uniref:Uncharacterized protein n=1 Tax=Melastoma candidum TaxID=119954 RepID=A0ACB9LI65_9MYRT|nr:hypothetical protein MLD38_035723 [Melastoma candidum]